MSTDYWVRRSIERMLKIELYGNAYADRIAQLYAGAYRQIEQDMRNLLDRFMEQGGLTDEEAHKYLSEPVSRADRDALMQRLYEIEDPVSRRKLLAQINSGSYAARAKRLRVLQDNIRVECAKVAQEQTAIQQEAMRKAGSEAYYRTIFDIEKGAGYATDFAKVSIQAIDGVLSERFLGQNYSDRIWDNAQNMADSLADIIRTNVTTGRSWERCITQVEEYTTLPGKGGLYSAMRLLRTETAYVMNELSASASEEMGADRYRFIAVIDFKTSKLCRAHDGLIDPDTQKPYTYKKRKRGVNFPPLHSWCRSCEAPIIDESTLDGLKRKALDPETGKLMDIPASMTYKQWYRKYVEKDPEAVLQETMAQNTIADRKQHMRYRACFGKYIPQNLADFQRMKYTNTAQWSYLKRNYKETNWMQRCRPYVTTGDGHSRPITQEPNSVYDEMLDGKVKTRVYYGNTGKPKVFIDATDHGNPKAHKVPHAHSGGDEKYHASERLLTLSEWLVNDDMFKGMKMNVQLW